MFILIVGVLLAAIALAAALTLLARLRTPAADPEWLERFSSTKYKPLARLLSDADYRFLESQPGYSPSISKRLRRERGGVIRDYLKMMARDFARLHAAAKEIAVFSAEDRSELVHSLLKQRLVFEYAIWSVRWRIRLHAIGVSGDVRKLVDSLENMGSVARQLRLAAASQAA